MRWPFHKLQAAILLDPRYAHRKEASPVQFIIWLATRPGNLPSKSQNLLYRIYYTEFARRRSPINSHVFMNFPAVAPLDCSARRLRSTDYRNKESGGTGLQWTLTVQ